MPKYVLIGLAIPVLLFVIMHYWSKFDKKTKNRVIASIFGIISVGFVILILKIHNANLLNNFLK